MDSLPDIFRTLMTQIRGRFCILQVVRWLVLFIRSAWQISKIDSNFGATKMARKLNLKIYDLKHLLD